MRKLTRVAIPLLGAALLFGACAGDDDGDAGSTATTTSTSSTSTATTAETAATEAPGSDDGDGGAFADLTAGFSSASFNVVYQVTGQGMDGEWHWVQDGDGGRMRLEMSQAGQPLVLITTPEDTLMCMEGSCLSMGALDESLPDLGDLIEESNNAASGGTVEPAGSREIAGASTECYDFTDDAGNSGSTCITEDGVPLFLETQSAEGSVTLEATSYSSDVSDADFEAPFPVQSLPGGMTLPTVPAQP